MKNPDSQASGEYQFTVNITPNDYSDPNAPIVPAEDGLLTAPDGSILTPYSLLELSQKSATTQRRQRKKTNDRNGDYIPRPPNPFILFRCWYTAKVHKPGSHDNADGSLSSLCGQEWANLGTQQRRIFEEAAKIEKLKHAERYPNYRYKPIHKKKQKSAPATFEDDDDGRPSRPRTKRPMTSSRADSNHSTTPTSHHIGGHPSPFPAALLRHRRSSSVPPLPSELQLCGSEMSVDPCMRPIEIPAAPFLALAGQDIPPPRKSRSSFGWDWSRGMSQILNEPPIFDYTALRTSIPSLPSSSAAPRHRGQLPTFPQNFYSPPAPPPFFTSPFAQQEGSIQWTNPNPFAAPTPGPSSSQRPPQLPPLGHDSTSSSSCSAPSPPPELEISPLDRVPGTDPLDLSLMPPTTSNIAYSLEPQEVQPFDLSIFKKSLDLSAIAGLPSDGRPRGMSIFDDPTPSHVYDHSHATHMQTMAPLSGAFATEFVSGANDLGYSRALSTSNLLAGVPAHEEIMEGFA